MKKKWKKKKEKIQIVERRRCRHITSQAHTNVNDGGSEWNDYMCVVVVVSTFSRHPIEWNVLVHTVQVEVLSMHLGIRQPHTRTHTWTLKRQYNKKRII